jgi:hypothetical protein
MSRSGYSDEEAEPGQFAMWRGQVLSAMRGKRGQQFFRDLLAALDALPVKRLAQGALEEPDPVCAAATYQAGLQPMLTPCAIGAVGQARKVDMAWFNPSDAEDDPDWANQRLSKDFNIASQLAAEVQYANDEGSVGVRVPDPSVSWGYRYRPETPEERWARMRAWAASNVRSEATITAGDAVPGAEGDRRDTPK